MRSRTRILLVAATLAALLPMLVCAEGIVPPVMSYQGRISVEGAPLDGVGLFKFAVVDSQGRSTWSNDGSSVDGREPAGHIALTVNQGLFSVPLGDPDLGMVPLTAEAFADPNTELRVWFSATGEGYALLDPDRPIASVPYAFVAELADRAFDADTVDGHHAGSFSPMTHDHGGQTWTVPGLGLSVMSDSGLALAGITSASTGFAYGVLGRTTAASGTTRGVVGESSSATQGS